MKKNRLAVSFLLSIFVVISFMPMKACRAESFATGESNQELLWLFLVDTDENNYAVFNSSMNFEDNKFQNFIPLSSWNFNPAKGSLSFIRISQDIEPKSLSVNFERSPRSPPSNSL